MRSLWPILPKTRPSGLVMPSMPHTEPFGFHVMSPLTLPHGVVYCVAIWPFSIELFQRCVIRYKATLTVRDRDGEDITCVDAGRATETSCLSRECRPCGKRGGRAC